jgi:adenosylcobinamide kinase/adenosylcobinamide-phosphate guanylyltransferase
MSALATTLVLGGARSGKSAFAQRLARASGLDPVYLATSVAGDEEMRQRIARHRADRGTGWRTIEEPLAVVETLERESAATRVILVECLTLWLSNLMLAERDVETETSRLIELLPLSASPLVLVSNEVGLGLVPDTPLGRRFRDAQGELNQAIAAAISGVVFVAAGLPLWLKCPQEATVP